MPWATTGGRPCISMFNRRSNNLKTYLLPSGLPDGNQLIVGLIF